MVLSGVSISKMRLNLETCHAQRSMTTTFSTTIVSLRELKNSTVWKGWVIESAFERCLSENKTKHAYIYPIAVTLSESSCPTFAHVHHMYQKTTRIPSTQSLPPILYIRLTHSEGKKPSSDKCPAAPPFFVSPTVINIP